MTIEELLKHLGKKAKLLPMGLKTPLNEIEVDNVVYSNGKIYPNKFKPDINFYKDIEGNIGLVFIGS